MATQLVRVGTSVIETVWVGEPVPPKAWGLMTGPSGDVYVSSDTNITKPPTLVDTTSPRGLQLYRLIISGLFARKPGNTSSVPDWRLTANTDDDPNNDFVILVIGNNGLGNISLPPGGSSTVVVGRGEQ